MTDPTSLPSFPPPDPLRARVVEALLDNGWEPAIDADGDVGVRIQDQSVFVRCLDSVPPLMRVFGQWLLDSSVPGDELVRLRAANAVTAAVNLVKVTLHEDRLSAGVELIVGEGVALAPLLASAVDAVLGAVHTWSLTVDRMLGDGGLDPEAGAAQR